MKIIRCGAVGSTMDECRALYAAGVRRMTAVSADEQTGGRGRVGRSWYSPAGSAVYVSVLLPGPIAAPLVSRCTMLGALAVLDAIEPFVDSAESATRATRTAIASIKWPNDVMLNGRKAAGVLVETSLLGERTEYLILGIGVNVNVDFANAPDDVRARACSLHEYARHAVDRDDVLERLVAAIERRALHFADAPEAAARATLEEYRARLATIGCEVTCTVDGRTLTGRADRVEDDGALVVVAGDCEHVLRFGDLA